MSSFTHYSLDVIRHEAQQLVERGVITRHQPIYTLCKYIPAREWAQVECELEENDFLLRNQIDELLGAQRWDND